MCGWCMDIQTRLGGTPVTQGQQGLTPTLGRIWSAIMVYHLEGFVYIQNQLAEPARARVRPLDLQL
jgi:hypothetical protein